MTDYTPETKAVRLGYSYRPNLPEGEQHHPPLLAEFDRWLAEHDRQTLEEYGISKNLETLADLWTVDIGKLASLIDSAVPNDIPGWRYRYSERIASALILAGVIKDDRVGPN